MTTMASPEQLLLELLNRARMDPLAEVARINSKLDPGQPAFTDLNQFIQPTMPDGKPTPGFPISPASKQVLAGNNILTGVAETHSVAMNASKVMETPGKNAHHDAGDGGWPYDTT